MINLAHLNVNEFNYIARYLDLKSMAFYFLMSSDTLYREASETFLRSYLGAYCKNKYKIDLPTQNIMSLLFKIIFIEQYYPDEVINTLGMQRMISAPIVKPLSESRCGGHYALSCTNVYEYVDPKIMEPIVLCLQDKLLLKMPFVAFLVEYYYNEDGGLLREGYCKQPSEGESFNTIMSKLNHKIFISTWTPLFSSSVILPNAAQETYKHWIWGIKHEWQPSMEEELRCTHNGGSLFDERRLSFLGHLPIMISEEKKSEEAHEAHKEEARAILSQFGLLRPLQNLVTEYMAENPNFIDFIADTDPVDNGRTLRLGRIRLLRGS